MGPVAVSAILILLFAAPLMRGGNRQVALIALEAIALVFLLSLWLGTVFSGDMWPSSRARISTRTLLIAFVLASPAWLALIYLVPVPAGFWSGAAGRGIYPQLLGDAGITPSVLRPLSLVPDATRVSLLAGIPLVAGFLAGYLARLPQLKQLLGLVVAMALAQVVLGLMQIAGGQQSSWYFGGDGGRPFGTFANANHFANYLGMALAAFAWLAWDRQRMHRPWQAVHPAVRFTSHHTTAIWIAGATVLVLGILLSRSRGAILSGLPTGMLALGLTLSSGSRSSNSWRFTLALIAGLLGAAVALVGIGALVSRFDLGGMASSASIRSVLAATTLAGAKEFWPWGAGWGTYAAVYPRFEPMGSDGVADFAHHDYAQMLFDGGIFSVVLAAAFVWLAGSRAVLLTRTALRYRRLHREEMACALCGLGLAGLLLHSLVDFNMHIPANAITGALLAGIYLRPLAQKDAQP